jgi:hypothetical protein
MIFKKGMTAGDLFEVIAITEPAFQDGGRFVVWGHRQIIIWGMGLPDCTFRTLICYVPVEN